MRFSLAVLLVALSPALSGCAAALVPVAAGGLILGSQVDEPDAQEPAALALAQDLPAQSTRTAGVQSAEDSAADLPLNGPQQMVILPRGSTLPPPGVFGTFVDRALERAEAQDEPRLSVLLVSPEQIVPELSPCGAEGSAVLIDLDPAGRLASTTGDAPLAPVLAGQLDLLRSNGVTVAWISDHRASMAADLRNRLRDTGLDPSGNDPLLLMRYPGEAKQKRRRALGRAFCLVAIAGDERGDFDDLYHYLRDPARAFPLEPLIGREWFIIPNPLD